jgi:hypothetical protein
MSEGSCAQIRILVKCFGTSKLDFVSFKTGPRSREITMEFDAAKPDAPISQEQSADYWREKAECLEEWVCELLRKNQALRMDLVVDPNVAQGLETDRRRHYREITVYALAEGRRHSVEVTGHLFEAREIDDIISFLRANRADLLVIGLREYSSHVAPPRSTVSVWKRRRYAAFWQFIVRQSGCQQ